MSLFQKVHTLLGALVHKPFMPRAENVDLEQDPGTSRETPDATASELEGQEPGVEDRERVADLIARRQRDGAG